MNTIEKMNYGEDNREYCIRAQHRLAMTLLQKVPPTNIHNIIDVGCGMGEFADSLEALGHSVSRVDGADHCVAYNRKKHYCNCTNLESDALPFADNTFDMAVSLDVIEHLWNTDHYLSEIKRVVKPNGYIILSTPNYNYIRYRLLCVIGRFDQFTYNSRHKKFFTTNSFKRLLEDRIKITNVVGTFAYMGTTQISHGLNLFGEQIGVLGRFK